MDVIGWAWQIVAAGLLAGLLIHKDSRLAFLQGFSKLVDNVTSKRFIVLIVATWFTYYGTVISSEWLYLAIFYIGVDTLQNNAFLEALAHFLKTKNGKVAQGGAA